MADQTWIFRNFTAAEGMPGVADFLNEPDRHGAGEACVVAGNVGSVRLLFLDPGALGLGTEMTWVFRDFTAPQGAVDFLNEPDRRGLFRDGLQSCSGLVDLVVAYVTVAAAVIASPLWASDS